MLSPYSHPLPSPFRLLVQCGVFLHDHTRVDCTLPAGLLPGNYSIVVTVGGQSNVVPSPALQLYVITGLSQVFGHQSGATALLLLGLNLPSTPNV
jgi:hypothetical protein